MGVVCRWDTWGRLIASHTSRFPWAVIEGNHEEEVANGKTGFLAYETRFWFPSEESRSYSPFYYSYEVSCCDMCHLNARSPGACSLTTVCKTQGVQMPQWHGQMPKRLVNTCWPTCCMQIAQGVSHCTPIAVKWPSDHPNCRV
jgi:hypothetical protein